MKNWVERVRKFSWGQLLFLASTSGVISGFAFAVLGVYGCDAIEMHLTHGKVTELGSAVLAYTHFLLLEQLALSGHFRASTVLHDDRHILLS
jgi:hypothetical protein